MTMVRRGGVGDDLSILFNVGAVGGESDAELLDRFVSGRRKGRGRGTLGSDPGAELAFSGLVTRYGPMVRGVCRRIVGDLHIADDAFQATFLILALKAGSVRFDGSLGPWLHGVGVRVARRARAVAAADRGRARGLGEVDPADPAPAVDRLEGVELGAAIDEEIARLPARQRAVVVLCDLEGLTQEQAARRLRCPLGTVQSRLHRGRTRLRDRLTRLGLVPSVGLPLALVTPKDVSAAVVERTVRVALHFLESRSTAATASAAAASSAALTERVLRTMILTKLKLAGVALLAFAGAVAVGAQRVQNAPGDPPAAAAVEAPRPAEDEAERKQRSVNLRRIALALHNYHSANGHFPSPAIVGKDGRPLLSWRVAILPFLELEGEGVKGTEALYKQFRLDEPWDSPHNKALLSKMPAPYRLPSVRLGNPPEAAGKDFEAIRAAEDERSGAIESYYRRTGKATSADYYRGKRELRELNDTNATFYRAFVGKGAAFEKDRGTHFDGLTDGPSMTMMVAEAETPVPWTKPEELPCSTGEPLPKLGVRSHDTFAALFVNGAVRFIDKGIDEASLRAMFTGNGGETVDGQGHFHKQAVTPPPRGGGYDGARTLEEALGVLKEQLSKGGQAEYAPLLEEPKVRKAILAATRQLGDRLRKRGDVDPVTRDIFQQKVQPAFLEVGGHGAWPRGCSFWTTSPLPQPQDQETGGCMIRLMFAIPGSDVEDFVLPILDVTYGTSRSTAF